MLTWREKSKTNLDAYELRGTKSEYETLFCVPIQPITPLIQPCPDTTDSNLIQQKFKVACFTRVPLINKDVGADINMSMLVNTMMSMR